MVMTYQALLEQGLRVIEKDLTLCERIMEEVQPEDVCKIIYTSGTTGPPKGAMLTHRNLTWMGRAIPNCNPMDDQDEVMSFLPLCHIFNSCSPFWLISRSDTS